MKKQLIFWTILVGVIFFNLPLVSVCGAEENITTDTAMECAFLETILEVNCGTEEDEVLYYKNETYGAGPEAFYVENKGSIYILDSVNKRINHYVKGVYVDSISLTSVLAPQCFCIAADGQVYVCDIYNGQCTLVIYKNSKEIKRYKLEEMQFINVKNISVTGNGRLNFSDWYDIYVYDIEKEGIAFVEKKPLKCVDTPGVSYSKFLGAKGNKHYEMQTTLVESSMVLGEISIVEFDKEENILGSARVPLEQYVYRPNQFVQIGKNGKIYLMIPTEEMLEIREVTLGKMSDSKLEEVRAFAQEHEKEQAAMAAYAVAPMALDLTRQEVLERANFIVGQSWTLSAENVYREDMSNITFPDYIQREIDNHSLENGRTVTLSGIPYCWGGFDSRYTSNTYPYQNFVEAIQGGCIAGNTDSPSTGKVPGTAGLDCSGFVSAAYGLSEKQGTWYFANNGTTVTEDTIGAMDILVRYGVAGKSNHVILFYNWQTSDKSRMLIMEVAVGRSDYDEKTMIAVVDTDDFVNNGYVMRTFW